MTASSLVVAAIDAPRTVADARHWLRLELARWSAAGLSDVAELVLSELVTNAMLHGHGPLRVSLSRRSGGLAIEVVDGNAHSGPTLRHYEADAATGHGLHVVERLCATWGVRTLAAGKGVWALLADPDDPERSPRCGERFSPAAWLLADPTAVRADEPPSPALRTRPARVVVADLPLWVYFENQAHHDALERELRLISQNRAAGSVPAHLLALAFETERPFATESLLLRNQVEAAREQGAATVDLELPISRRSWERLLRLKSLLEDADRHCERGELLTLASSPTVRRFRAWFAQEFAAQLDGRAPSPWPGPYERPPRGGPRGGEADEADDGDDEADDAKERP